jgi:hypothetical protein
MDTEGFKAYLKKGGRSPNATNRCLRYVSEFEIFLLNDRGGKRLANTEDEDLLQFVLFLDQDSKTTAKGYLWAIIYYYDYISNDEMRDFAKRLRAERIVRKPFALKDFRGVNQEYVDKLKANGIRNVNQMIEAGKTPQDRQRLAEISGIPDNAILEFVKLSDLARIPGIKGIRARLYYDVGIDSVEELGTWDPEQLRETVVDFVEKTGFDGIPTLPAEARFAIEKAKNMPKIVEYD